MSTSRFARLPRAARWLIWTALAIVVYFGIVEPALDARNRFAAAADTLERDLRELAALTGPSSDAGTHRETVLTHFGRPAPPAALTEIGRPPQFESAVNEIFRRRGVRKDQTERRSVITLPQEAAIVGEGQMMQRQELTLTFEAGPATVAEILADLEAEPLVTAVTRVRLDKAVVRRSTESERAVVKATIGVETWMIVPQPGAGGGS